MKYSTVQYRQSHTVIGLVRVAVQLATREPWANGHKLLLHLRFSGRVPWETEIGIPIEPAVHFKVLSTNLCSQQPGTTGTQTHAQEKMTATKVAIMAAVLQRLDHYMGRKPANAGGSSLASLAGHAAASTSNFGAQPAAGC